jgi:hypothetical protein
MFSSHVAVRNKSAFTMLCFSLGLLAASAAVSQEAEVAELEVVGGNSSNSLMFGLNYGLEAGDIDEAITLNDDANAYPSLNSFTFVLNTCGESRTDVVAASTNASRLVIYAGGRGTGAPICGETGQAACPARPVGLSTSIEQLISVATSGASGTTPGVFTFAAGNDESTCATFSRRGGDLSVGSNRIRAIADTEFVRGNGGDLEAGDLLVLVSNPAMIVRVTPDGIGQSGASGAEFANSLAVFAGYRRATPTGLAIVPGETPNVLVTLSTGAIVNFYYNGAGWVSKSFDTGGLFPNPRGIGAGSREGAAYIVVSEQNRGRYIRVEVEEDASGSLVRSGGPGAYREIVTPVGAPEGIAVSQEDPDLFVATKCFNPESEEPTGCNFGPGDLHFSQGFEGGLEGESLRFNVQYIPDPENNSARDENGLLRLPHPCDDDASCVAQDFFVPASCRGYDTTDADPALGFNGVPHLVLVDIDLLDDFFVTSGNFAQVTERVKDTLGVDGECTETGARVYYHPSKDLEGNDLVDADGFTLFDVTVSCQNPSRGISELRSPVVFCVDPNYVARKTNPEAGRNEFVNTNIRIFIEDLKAAVSELGSDFPVLSSTLNSLLVGFTNPDMGSGKVPGYYVDTWEKADAGAVAVLELKRSGAFTDADLPSDLYARLLRGFLGLAFYTKETGLAGYDGSAALAEFEARLGDFGVKYYPPAEFCNLFDEDGDPFNVYEGEPYPELQDVICDCSKVPSYDPNNYQTCAL